MARLLLASLVVVAAAVVAEKLYYPSTAEMLDLTEAVGSFAENREECCLDALVDITKKIQQPTGMFYFSEDGKKDISVLQKPENIKTQIQQVFNKKSITDVYSTNNGVVIEKHYENATVSTGWTLVGARKMDCQFKVNVNSTIGTTPKMYEVILDCYNI